MLLLANTDGKPQSISQRRQGSLGRAAAGTRGSVAGCGKTPGFSRAICEVQGVEAFYFFQCASSRETNGSGLRVELYVMRCSFFTRTFAAVGVNAIAETNTS